MFGRLLESRSFWWLFHVIAIVLFYGAFEGGYRFGAWRRAQAHPEQKTLTGTVLSALLALLSFLLAISFGIAADRFGQRKALVLDEANAIGTTFLRADFLPEPQRSNVRRQLEDYCALRIEAVERDAELTEPIERSEAMQDEMWAEAATVAKARPGDIPVALFVDELNHVIDLHRSRLTVGLRYRIPPSLIQALYLVTVLAMATLGLYFGLAGTRSHHIVWTLLVSIGAVLLIIVELDRPDRRVFRVNQSPLIETLNAMRRSDAQR